MAKRKLTSTGVPPKSIGAPASTLPRKGSLGTKKQVQAFGLGKPSIGKKTTAPSPASAQHLASRLAKARNRQEATGFYNRALGQTKRKPKQGGKSGGRPTT